MVFNVIIEQAHLRPWLGTLADALTPLLHSGELVSRAQLRRAARSAADDIAASIFEALAGGEPPPGAASTRCGSRASTARCNGEKVRRGTSSSQTTSSFPLGDPIVARALAYHLALRDPSSNLGQVNGFILSFF